MSSNRLLLLIRHAETDSAGTFCGHSDPPVNDRGKSQIAELVADLARYKIEVVHSSDLRRALATAEAIASCFSARLRITSNLREIGFGEWEDSTWEQIEHRDPSYVQRWVAEFPKLAAPAGEEFGSFEKRVLNEFDAIVSTNEKAAVVAHAGTLRVILTQRCGLSDEQAWAATKTYCGVFHYRDGSEQPYEA